MFLRIAVMTFVLGLTGPAIAATAAAPLRKTCLLGIPNIRHMWQEGAFEAPPAAATLMVDAIDGNLPLVRRQLRQMSPTNAQRWRQNAMIAAAWAGQPVVVNGMLDDGALVDASAWTPPLKTAFAKQGLADLKKQGSHSTRYFVTKRTLTQTLQNNHGERTGPALMGAVTCGDVATVDVLLRHHVNIAQREGPDIEDALEQATIDGDAPTVQRLLDHGADPCADDRDMAQQHLRDPAIPLHTMAQVGTRAKLPAALVARLTCPAVAATH